MLAAPPTSRSSSAAASAATPPACSARPSTARRSGPTPAGSCRYVLPPDGIKVAVFCTKLHNRLLRPLLAADQPQAPPEPRAALHAIDQHVGTYIARARLS